MKKKEKSTSKLNTLKKNNPVSAKVYDRDKNKTYIANDESIDDIFDETGREIVVHANHKVKSKKK